MNHKSINFVLSPSWRTDFLFAGASKNWLVHVGVVALTLLLILSAPESKDASGKAIIWFCTISVFSFSAVMLAKRYLSEKQKNPYELDSYTRHYAVLTAIIGTLWGLGAFIVAPLSNDLLMLYTLVVGGTALGAVSTQHVEQRVFLASIWTAIPLLALAHITHTVTNQNLAVAIMIVLYGVIITMLGKRMQAFLTKNAELSLSLADKVSNLTLTTAELERIRLIAENNSTAKSRLLAHISHDLRQPVHAIGLFAECLKDHATSQETRALLSQIEQSVISMSGLFRSLLDLTALENGRVRSLEIDFALDEVLGGIILQNQAAAQERGVTLRYVPNRLWVRTDPALLSTMVQNLVANAIKYAPGAKVLIGCRRQKGRISVEVHDTGPGFEPGDIDRVFEEFVRLTPVENTTVGGLGLGLSIVRKLSDILGLAVDASSKPPNGTVFRISGLVRAEAAAASREVDHQRIGSQLDGARIFVVDDDTATREGMRQLLQKWGCDVSVFAAPPDLEIARAADFLFVDRDLGPGVDGLAYASQTKQSLGVPAAIVTGSLSRDIEDGARAAGLTVLEKPARPAQVRSLLLTVLSGQTKPASAAAAAAADRVGTSNARSSAET
ncbi:hybrid sensor histidine kinase/response regulator [Rhodospirillaceae bacterium KN72]|uniref:histidine kinase n=1 Tax=Pacificispira spongiicola TaxID=2729598 RepID=A0A7Y0DXW0_9PROT|nr:hybrid sensor histidine kinase/response regulator [Pacificispira spongiicola]NMM43586.1 hybrid sensor histidine kinase/response regulator [Pacificispira spongiicola]